MPAAWAGRLLLAMLLAGLALAAAGCGDDDDDDNGPTPSATSSPVATPTAVVDVCLPNPAPPDEADPSVIVDEPTEAQTVERGFTVSGQARVFEAAVSISLFDADGNVLSQSFVMASIGAPEFGDFEATIDYDVAEQTPGCLWVFEASARDGEPINVVQVPLLLEP
jgi:hypothetical protein